MRESILKLAGLIMTGGLFLAAGPATAADPDLLARGKYLVHAGACGSCHTNRVERGAWLAGGRSMRTPYGEFHVPNITPDPETGIGRWTETDFIRAMTEGVSPEGAQYYPIFPYLWYRNMTREDLGAMWAYLQSIPPVHHEVKPHEISFPFSLRPLIMGWKVVNYPGPPEVAEGGDPLVQRGDYLVNALGHCGACHTPAFPFYIYKDWNWLAGHADIPGAYAASNITPDLETGIGRWSEADMVRAMAHGLRPGGWALRGPMADYVADGSRHLTPEDLRAINAYLRSIEPVRKEAPLTETPHAYPEAHDEAPMGGSPIGADLALGRAVALGVVGEPEHACHRCHSIDAGDPASDGMPRVDGQDAGYLARQLVDYAAGSRWSPVMQPIAAALDAAEREAVAAFYASLPGPEIPPTPPRTLSERGRVLALEGDPALGIPACISCHGVLGMGVPPSFPYLAGQDYLYMELQLALWRDGRRRNDLIDSMGAIARRLSREDSRAVSVYFAGLAADPGPAPVASRTD